MKPGQDEDMDPIEYQPRFRVPIVVEAGNVSRRDTPLQADIDPAVLLSRAGASGDVDPGSLRLVPQDGQDPMSGVPVQAARDSASGTGALELSWILKGALPAQGRSSYWLYLDTQENAPKEPATAPSGVVFRRTSDNPRWNPVMDNVLEVEVEGRLFAIYNYNYLHAHLFKPYFHPIIGPSGRPITQVGEYPGTLKGHYWHRGLFVAHQHVNGISFWEEREGDEPGVPWKSSGRILHQEFTEVAPGPVYGRFVERNRWRNPDGSDVLEESRRVTIYNLPADRRIMDFRLTLASLGEPVTFGARPYNLLACRLSDAMNISAHAARANRQWHAGFREGMGQGGGKVLSSEGDENVASLHEGKGKSARWMDHSGPNGPEWEGLAMFDNPTNQRYPSWWLNWENMTMGPSFSYNEPYTIPSGGSLTLNYRLYIHAGDATEGQVSQHFDDYSQPAVVRVGEAERVRGS